MGCKLADLIPDRTRVSCCLCIHELPWLISRYAGEADLLRAMNIHAQSLQLYLGSEHCWLLLFFPLLFSRQILLAKWQDPDLSCQAWIGQDFLYTVLVGRRGWCKHDLGLIENHWPTHRGAFMNVSESL